MADTTYDIVAQMRLAGGAQVAGQVGAIGAKMSQLGQRIRGNNIGLGATVKRVVALGAAYVGVRALARGFGAVVRSAIQMNSQLETAQIGIASILSAQSGQDFAQSMGVAEGIYQRLQIAATASTAHTQDMLDIFSQIVGPMRTAGKELSEIEDITVSAVAAASALNVDFAQAARDIGVIAEGRAGADVKTFQRLVSAGLMPAAQEFNNMIPEERAKLLQEALSKFDIAAEAYGMTIKGLTSTISEQMGLMAMMIGRPIIDAFKRPMADFAAFFVRHMREIQNTFTVMGQMIAARLELVFDKIRAGMRYITNNWQTILDKVVRVVQMVRNLAPPAFLLMLGVRMGRMLLGGAIGGAGMGVSMIGGILSAIGSLANIVPALTAMVGGGTAAASTAAAGGGLVAGAIAAAPIVLPAVGVGLAIIMSAAIALVGVLASLASAIYFVFAESDFMKQMMLDLVPSLEILWANLWALGEQVWALIGPLMKLAGALVVYELVKMLTLAIATLNHMIVDAMSSLYQFADAIGHFAESVGGAVGVMMQGIANSIRNLPGKLTVGPGAEPGTGVSDAFERWQSEFNERMAEMSAGGPGSGSGRAGGMGGGGARQSVTNDFRGSRINVNQEFRRADPDRIAIQLTRDIERQAGARIQSGMVSPFTR